MILINQIITWAFYLLFFITPLFWTSSTYELFEFNKMMLTYLFTIIILFGWLAKMVLNKQFIFKRTPLDIPILLFLIANILATIFSFDKHMSLFGYYSRLNGGLLSIISYTILFYAFVSNFEFNQIIKFLKVTLWGGLLVALWAIPEHFGASPSCAILKVQNLSADGISLGQILSEGGVINATCWVQDVQARVFATFGQPNWLASYLGMLIFPALYFLLTSKTRFEQIKYFLISIALYLAFTFTYSRSATLGLFAGLGVFLILPIFSFKSKRLQVKLPNNLRLLAVVIMSFLLVNILFGSSLTRFKLFLEDSPLPQTQQSAPSTTQLETGGTESGQIRFIVWKGALDIFKQYPILGTGVETFALAYYNFRPQEHNLTSEWDFLYNKAHNEFLNYLSNTGAVGFISYIAIILVFIIWVVKKVIIPESKIKDQPLDSNSLLLTSLLGSYISYHVSNFFGFSVVMTAILFFLFPAMAFISAGAVFPLTLPKLIIHPLSIFNKRPLYSQLSLVIISILALISLYMLYRVYTADTIFNQGYRYSELGNPGRAYNLLNDAIDLNPYEPFYRSELAYAAAASSAVLKEDDATLSAELKDEAVWVTEELLNAHPKNVSFFRTGIRTYYFLSTINQSYIIKTLELLDKAMSLAPTDAKLTYNKAVVLSENGKIKEAIPYLEKTLELKPNYVDAHYALGLLYIEEKQNQKAITEMDEVLKLIPEHPEAKEKLELLKKQPS